MFRSYIILLVFHIFRIRDKRKIDNSMTVSSVYGQSNAVLSGEGTDHSTLEPSRETEDHPYESVDMTVMTSSRAYEHLPGQNISGENDSPYATVDEIETNA